MLLYGLNTITQTPDQVRSSHAFASAASNRYNDSWNALWSFSKRGIPRIPSVARGSWRPFSPSPGVRFSDSDCVIMEQFISGAWVRRPWETIYDTNNSSSPLTLPYRFRAPLPASGRLRIEWEELVDKPATGSGSTVTISGGVLDPCYRGATCNFSSGSSGNLRLLEFSPFAQSLTRLTPASASVTAYGMGGPSDIPVISSATTLTAAPVLLRGAAQLNGGRATPGEHALAFAPANGATGSAQCLGRLYEYTDTASTDASGNRVFPFAGATITASGSALNTPIAISCPTAAQAPDFRPRYTGGEFISCPISYSGTDLARTRLWLVQSAWDDSWHPIRPTSFSGTFSQIARSHEFTRADLPGGYDPANQATWPVSPTFNLVISDFGLTSWLTLPRFSLP